MRRAIITAVASVSVALLFSQVTEAAAAAPVSETLMLDSYSASNSQAMVTSSVLPAGTYHFVTVTGTANFWGKPLTCGTPAVVQFPSPAKPQGDQGGFDAETIFAELQGAPGACVRALPRNGGGFRIDAGNGPIDPDPIGGRVDAPNPAHSYQYLIAGKGTSATMTFALSDRPTSDNYGQFKIETRQATKDDCRDSGWTRFGVFKNQGDCVSFMATSEKNQPSGA
jgi:hypothetical protein